MVAKAYTRGNEIHFVGEWVYEDGVSSTHERPCVRCGRLPTTEGYDACLGFIPGAVSACCGHGIEKSFVMMREK